MGETITLDIIDTDSVFVKWNFYSEEYVENFKDDMEYEYVDLWTNRVDLVDEDQDDTISFRTLYMDEFDWLVFECIS